MLNDCVVNALSGLAVLAILPVVIVGFFIFAVFFAAPSIYFLTRPNIRKLKLYEKYREEAVHLRGDVLKRWTSKGEKTTSHHIKVIYNIHEERYIKDLRVSPTAYLQARLDLMVLPLYPRSAILLEAQKTDVVGADSFFNWFGILWSFPWTCVWNIFFVHNIMVISMVRDTWLEWAVVACEVIVAWIIGYFMACAFVNHELRDILFGAKIVDSSNNIIPLARTPNLTYQEMFPSLSKTSFCSIIWMIITDYAKLLGSAVIIVYCQVFGGGYLLMKPFFIDRKMKQLFADYKAKGMHLTGETIKLEQTISSNWETGRIQYDAPNDCLSTVQRYEKTLTLSCAKYLGHQQESPTISDNPRIIILKDIPTSAQLADEIDIREKYYGTGLYGTGCGKIFVTIILFAAQAAYFCFAIGGPAFPDIRIFVALQIGLGCASASLHFCYLSNDILHNAQNVPAGKSKVIDSEDNIELATSPLDDSDGLTNVTDPISLRSNEDDWTLSGAVAMGGVIS